MKRLSLLLLTVFVIFAFSGCGREEARTGAGTAEKPAVAGSPTVEVVSPKLEIPTLPSSEALLVADFNSGSKPSNIGGDFGAWDKDPADFTQSCTDSFDSAHKFGESGFSIKLDYDVDSSNAAYNGFWMKLNNLDATRYEDLAFLVKGDIDAGYTTIFKIELKRANGETAKYYVTGVDSEWKKISIPLSQFQGLTSLKNLSEFVIVFEDMIATNKEGVIYIDDIQFTR